MNQVLGFIVPQPQPLNSKDEFTIRAFTCTDIEPLTYTVDMFIKPATIIPTFIKLPLITCNPLKNFP